MKSCYSTGCRNDDGSVTVLVLLLLTLLGGAIGGLIARSLIATRATVEEQNADNRNLEFWAGVSNEIPETSAKRDHCIRSPQVSISLCLWLNPTAAYKNIPGVLNPAFGVTKERFPVWETSSFYSHNEDCSSEIVIPSEISSGVLTSSYSCLELSDPNGDLTVRGNLFLETPLKVNTARLNVAGSAKIRALSVNAPSIIFTAGDLLIEQLTVSSPDLAPVFLVSTSGKVSIGVFQGPPVLTVSSPTEVIFPAGSISNTIAELTTLTRPLIMRGISRQQSN